MSRQRFRHTSLRNTVWVLFVVLAAVLALNILFVEQSLQGLREAQQRVQISNKCRLLAQSILLESRKVLTGNENLKVNLNEMIQEHAFILKTLELGGTIQIDKEVISISATTQAQSLNSLQQTAGFWKKYKAQADKIATEPLYENIEAPSEEVQEEVIAVDIDIDSLLQSNTIDKKVLNPAVLKAYAQLYELSEEMQMLNKQLATNYASLLDSKRQEVRSNMILLIVADIALLFFFLWIIRNILFQPMRRLIEAAAKIQEGDLSEEIALEEESELGDIAYTINTMRGNLLNATNFVRNMEQGKLDTIQIRENASNLELALVEMRDRMRSVAKEETQRQWVTERLAAFVDVLRENNNDTQALSYAVVSNIVEYVNAHQGGLYILNNEAKTPQAELMASYAFGRQRYLKQAVLPGEGLIGQVLLEKDTVYINDLPDDYYDISSGLGAASPRAILIVPLKLNEVLLGMIEIASFEEIEDYKIQFIERLAGNVASTIASVKANESNAKFLQEQKIITQQLRTQEEEMRQNMEELQATQEEMLKNEAVLNAQSFAISTALLSAEYDTDGYLLHANELFLQKFKYDLEQAKGKHHRIFLDTESAYNEQYVAFWEALLDRKPQTGDYKQIAKGGGEVWIRATYVPIPDRFGSVYKIICLAFDITEEKQQMIDYQAQVEAVRRSYITAEFDLQGEISEVNEGFLEITKYTRSEVLGKHYNFLFHKEEADDDAYKLLWRKLKSGIHEVGEFEYLDKLGEKIYLQASLNPIYDLNGNTFKVVMFATDITKRKETERQIQEVQQKTKAQQEHLTALINSTEDRIFAIDKRFFVTTLNDNARAVFQQMRREVEVGANLLDTFPPENYEALKKVYDQALRGERVKQEESFVNIKGEEVLLWVSYTPIFDDEDKVQGVTVFARDITELKKREQQLREEQQQLQNRLEALRTVMNHSEEMIFRIDSRFVLQAFNLPMAQQVKSTLGWEIRIGDATLERLHPPTDTAAWQALYQKAFAGEAIAPEAAQNLGFGRVRTLPLTDAQGKIYNVVFYLKK
jgi:PAS domain S-box-containing protein